MNKAVKKSYVKIIQQKSLKTDANKKYSYDEFIRFFPKIGPALTEDIFCNDLSTTISSFKKNKNKLSFCIKN